MEQLQDAVLGVERGGRLTEHGRNMAYEISRTMDYYTAHATALLYAEVSRLVAMRLAGEASQMNGKDSNR